MTYFTSDCVRRAETKNGHSIPCRIENGGAFFAADLSRSSKNAGDGVTSSDAMENKEGSSDRDRVEDEARLCCEVFCTQHNTIPPECHFDPFFFWSAKRDCLSVSLSVKRGGGEPAQRQTQRQQH